MKTNRLNSIQLLSPKFLFILMTQLITVFCVGQEIVKFEYNSSTAVQTVKNTNETGYSVINFQSSSGDQIMGIGYANSSTAWNSGNAYIGVGSSKNLTFMMNSVEQLRLTSSGDVGIGTSVPSSKLDVNGNLRIRSVPMAASGNDILVIDGDGNVMKSSISSLQVNVSDLNKQIQSTEAQVRSLLAQNKKLLKRINKLEAILLSKTATQVEFSKTNP